MDVTGLTAAIIARDEERNIGGCLDSIGWADERLVLDGGSQDGTLEQARSRAGTRVEERPFDTFPRQRNAAMKLAAHDWILFVDADERVTSELAAEVRQVIQQPKHDGYYIPRHNRIFGKIIRHTGWYPDYQLRLLDRRRGHYLESVPVHEVVSLDRPPAGHLHEHLLHENYRTIQQFWRKQ
ncbi:MAG: glycosyltransferase family 2 protein, partial [Chloroflexota bacterium]